MEKDKNMNTETIKYHLENILNGKNVISNVKVLQNEIGKLRLSAFKSASKKLYIEADTLEKSLMYVCDAWFGFTASEFYEKGR